MGEIDARRPKVVDAAVALLAILLVVGFFRSMHRLDATSLGVSPATVVALLLVGNVLVAALIARIADARDWARVAYLCTVVYSIARSIGMGLPEDAAEAAIRLGFHAAHVIAMALLFSPPANAWFREARKLRSEAVQQAG